MTTLSILIPTQGRASLERAIRSCVAAGIRQDDEILVIDDSHEGGHDREIMGMIFDSGIWTAFYQPVAFYLAHDAGHHCYGHCPLNYGLERARGDYILCQDDDDIYADGAFDRIRSAIDSLKQPRPLLFRFQSWWGPVFWDAPGKALENHIGGHCAVFPRDERLGRFTCRYQGDYDYIRSTLDNWGGDDQAVWVDDVIAIARPHVLTREKVFA